MTPVLSNGEQNMIKRSQYVAVKRSTPSQENQDSKKSGDDRSVGLGGGTKEQCSGDLPKREHRAKFVLPVEAEIQGSWDRRTAGDEARSKNNGLRKNPTAAGSRTPDPGTVRDFDRTHASEKKRELKLIGDLRGRHLADPVRQALLGSIEEAVKAGESFERACRTLELNPRAVYRWKSGKTSSPNHGGGGGLNRITPLEEKRVLTLARKFPHFRCRRIAYELERKSLVFIGKTKVAEILKKHGLNHTFEQGEKTPPDIPGELLLHEPWRKNLLWGTDWTYLRIAEKFWFLLVILDWYSRKIVAWGLFPEITRFEVVAVITSAVATERIDELPEGAMKPRVVADHGSANIAAYTRRNIEIQGLELWLSGIGRPTGNARTERVIGTLKREEIKLQEQYEDEAEARRRIDAAIFDYNFRRPNAGNGGFSPNSVHLQGRAILNKRRKEARQSTENRRRRHWEQNSHSAENISY